MMSLKTYRTLIAMAVLTLLVIAAVFAAVGMTSASADNLYAGAWACDYADVRLDIFDCGILQIVYPDDPGTGYRYEYIFGYNGELIALDSGSAVVLELVMFDYNTLGDTDGNYWYRIA